jgi:hypothetical protein
MKGNTMKLLQTALFSMLMGMTLAAYADSKLDKDAAKCDQLEEQMEEAQVASKEAEGAENEARDQWKSDRISHEEYMGAVRAHKSLQDKWTTIIPNKMKSMDCKSIRRQKREQDQGLSPN